MLKGGNIARSRITVVLFVTKSFRGSVSSIYRNKRYLEEMLASGPVLAVENMAIVAATLGRACSLFLVIFFATIG